MRTQGEITTDYKTLVCRENGTLLAIGYSYGDVDEAKANTHTWATAHNVANKLDADGVDGLAAINALPKLVSELKRVRSIDNQEQRLAERGIAVMQFWKSIQRQDAEYEFPDFAKRDWVVSDETKKHMEAVAMQSIQRKE